VVTAGFTENPFERAYGVKAAPMTGRRTSARAAEIFMVTVSYFEISVDRFNDG